MRSSRRQAPSIAGTIGSLVDNHIKDRASLNRIRDLSLVARTTSALIHELQKERGLSSGFVAGAGRRFAQELPDQRKRTDLALASASESWGSIEPSPRYGSLEAALGEARSAVIDLADFRADVRARALTPNAVVQRFSLMIDRLLVVIAEVPGTSPHPQVTLSLIALFNFLLAKEYTGQVRALGSAVCAQEGFEPFQFERYQGLLRQREEALETFMRHALRDQLERWREAQNTEAMVQWDHLKTSLETLGTENQGRAPDPEDWYRWCTAAVDTMRTVENSLLNDLEDLCRAILAETRSAWEDTQESPDALDETLVLRLERAQLRLWEERRELRQVTPAAVVARRPLPESKDPLQALVEASANAAEQLQRWRRDLDRWDAAVREANEKSRQAKVLSLDAAIPAFSRSQVAAGARDLAQGLLDLAGTLETRLSGLKVAVDRTLGAQEQWHERALALVRSNLEQNSSGAGHE